MRILVVDAANVVGSRPDGWWRDRAAAAQRLYQQLASVDLPHDEVVLVLEGEARQGKPAGRDGRVRTVHASRSGDEAIVDVVRDRLEEDHSRDIIVVTADRELQTRVEALGGAARSPSWLRDQL